MINLFGKGFIGNHYFNMYPCIINDRNDLVPQSPEILYMISTVDNYNVKTNPHLDIDTNLTTLIRVLEKWRQSYSNGIFNFASSWFVYGNTDLPAREDSYCDPKGFYSITKRTAEQLLISYCETFNLNYRILRFANVLGPGDSKISLKKNATTYIINEMKNNRPVNLYEKGEPIRDFIHVKDLCRAVNIVLEKGELNSIYNIGNGVPIKMIEIVNKIKNLGSESQINMIEQSKFHKMVQVKSMYMDNSRLVSLGYKPEYTIDKIVEELFNL